MRSLLSFLTSKSSAQQCHFFFVISHHQINLLALSKVTCGASRRDLKKAHLARSTHRLTLDLIISLHRAKLVSFILGTRSADKMLRARARQPAMNLHVRNWPWRNARAAFRHVGLFADQTQATRFFSAERVERRRRGTLSFWSFGFCRFSSLAPATANRVICSQQKVPTHGLSSFCWRA